MIQAFVRILSLYIIYDWIIIIMGDSKHELSTINILHPYGSITATSPQQLLSSVPKVAVVERFDCNISPSKLNL